MKCFSIVLFLINYVFGVVPKESIITGDINVLIVTPDEPNDGHLRFHRSCEFAHLNPKICPVGPKTHQLTAIQTAIQNIKSNRNDFILVTPSDRFIITKQKSILIVHVASVLMSKNGHILMAQPHYEVHQATKWDQPIQNIIDKNNAGYEFIEFSPRPSTWSEWLSISSEYSKYKTLKVKQRHALKQQQLSDAGEFCAFMGLQSSMVNFLENLMNNDDIPKNFTILELCHRLSSDTALRLDFKVIIDKNQQVFKFVQPIYDKKPGIMLDIDDNIVYAAENYNFGPISCGSLDQIPFDLLNVATGDVSIHGNCKTCIDKPFKFDSKFKNEKEYPHIGIFILRYSPYGKWQMFLENLQVLTYPQDKIHLYFIINGKGNEEFEKVRKNEEKMFNKYKSVSFSSTEPLIAIEIFDQFWKKVDQNGIDYALILDPATRLTNNNAIQLLISKNKRIIGPFLKKDKEKSNFFENRFKCQLYNNHFYGNYITGNNQGEMSFNTTVQVPYVFGAALMHKSIVKKVNNPFSVCAQTCEPNNLNCTSFENKQRLHCEKSYYHGLNQIEDILWGMMMKSITEQGCILYLTNEHEFGYI